MHVAVTPYCHAGGKATVTLPPKWAAIHTLQYAGWLCSCLAGWSMARGNRWWRLFVSLPALRCVFFSITRSKLLIIWPQRLRNDTHSCPMSSLWINHWPSPSGVFPRTSSPLSTSWSYSFDSSQQAVTLKVCISDGVRPTTFICLLIHPVTPLSVSQALVTNPETLLLSLTFSTT